jgi:hypothetical protein
MWIFFLAAASLLAQDWQAGIAVRNITPEGPIWMSGYAARKKPSEGVFAPLHAKALALDDGRGGRVVFVTTDIIGYPRNIAEEIAIAALKQYKLERSQLVLNASHTHSGPVIWPNLSSMYFLEPAEQAKVEAYARRLVTEVTTLIGAALADLKPAQVERVTGKATFAKHRRLPTPEGIKNAPNETGPVDHSVPTVRVRRAGAAGNAVLFGYSCHNTTMTAEFHMLSGDYAGFAQAEVEARQSGYTALFATGCAGDQNPYPRSSPDLARQHGKALGDAVIATLALPGEPLRGRIRSRFQVVDLPYQPFGRNDFEAELNSSDVFVKRRAELVLKAMDERRLSSRLPYPIQAIQLGQARVVTLGGEVVVDYCLRLRKELNDPNLFVMAYSNDVMCYIPTRQQIAEGGYEAKESFVYYGQPAPLSAEVEDIIINRVKSMLRSLR